MASLYKSYVGEFVTDAACLAYIQLAKWDDIGDGTGNPQDGMMYYNVSTKSLRKYNGTLAMWFNIADDSINNTIYVDVNSTKTTSPDGTPHNPYRLIQDAINDVISRGDNILSKPYVIYVKTGDYTAEGQIILENANLVNLVIIGESSPALFGINGVEIVGFRSTSNNDNFLALTIKNIYASGDTEFEGASNGTSFMLYGAHIENCVFNSNNITSFSAYNAWGFSFYDCEFGGSGSVTVDFLNVYYVYFYRSLEKMPFTLSADNASKTPMPGTGVGILYSYNSIFNNDNTFRNSAAMNTAGYFYTSTIGNPNFGSTLNLPDGNTYVFTDNSYIYKNINLGGGILFINGTWYNPNLVTITGGTLINNNYSKATYYDNSNSGLTANNVQDAIDEIVNYNIFTYFNANDAIFPAIAPATAGSRNGHTTLDFDDTTDENVIFEGVVPSIYTGNNITVKIHWVAKTATSNDVVWNAAWERDNANGHDIDSDSFAAAQSVIDTAPAISGQIKVSAITFTQAQADGIVGKDAYRLKVTRNASNASDTLVGDAQILRISIEST